MMSCNAVDHAVELAKRVKTDLIVSSRSDQSQEKRPCNEILRMPSSRLDDALWISHGADNHKKSSPYRLHAQRPFSSKATRVTSPQKNISKSKSVLFIAEMKPSSPTRTFSAKSTRQKAFGRPRSTKKFKKIHTEDEIKEMERRSKAIIRDRDPSFGRLFVPGSETTMQRFPYTDPLPPAIDFINGSNLDRKRWCQNDAFVKKVLELRKAVEASISWEKQGHNKMCKDNTLNRIDAFDPSILRKTRSMESLRYAYSTVRASRPEDRMVRTKSAVTLSGLEREGRSSSFSNLNRRICWEGGKRRKEYDGNGRHCFPSTGDYFASTKFCKPHKVSTEEREKNSKNPVYEQKHKKCLNDPARAVRENGIKRYLAAQHTYRDEQITSSRIVCDSHNGSSCSTGQRHEDTLAAKAIAKEYSKDLRRSGRYLAASSLSQGQTDSDDKVVKSQNITGEQRVSSEKRTRTCFAGRREYGTIKSQNSVGIAGCKENKPRCQTALGLCSRSSSFRDKGSFSQRRTSQAKPKLISVQIIRKGRPISAKT